jgi:hypothetical protein
LVFRYGVWLHSQEEGKMKMRDAGVVLVAAVATLAVGIAARRATSRAVAAEQGKEQPSLTVDGVVLTLATEKAAYKAGEKPVLRLAATNTRGRAASARVTVVMTTMERLSPMSRRMPVARKAWSFPCDIALGPRETKRLDLPVDAALLASNVATFSLEAGEHAIPAASLSVQGQRQVPAQQSQAAQLLY